MIIIEPCTVTVQAMLGWLLKLMCLEIWRYDKKWADVFDMCGTENIEIK